MAKKTPQKLALCIGINNYPGTDNDLNGCVNDANDWAAELKKHGFTTTLLLDNKASGKNIRSGIKNIIAAAGSGDTVVITYSGHGTFVDDLDGDEPDGHDECIVPQDFGKGVITDDELFTLYSDRARGVRLLILSDSCNSGTVARFAPITTPPTMAGPKPPQRRVRFLPPAEFLSRKRLANLGGARSRRRASSPGRNAGLLMAGCQDWESSWDAWFNSRANGAFTFVALRELRKLKANATYRDWFNAIRAALPSRQYPQTPNLFGSSTSKKWKVFQ